MGFTPSEINAMSLWEYVACTDGHRGKANKPDTDRAFEAADSMDIEGL